MKSCELCKNVAVTFCDSDQASLCWSCDAKVHSANFLVARHSRSLLCHVCQSLTPWSATGSKLGPTISVCERCLPGAEDDDDEEEEESDGGTIADEEDVDVEDEENQVVPWFTSTASPPPPPASSSSSSDDESFDGQAEVRKRSREDALDRSYNVVSEDMMSQTIRTPPSLAEDTTEESGRGCAEDETPLDSSSATSTLKRRRPLKAHRIISGRIDRIQEASE